MSATTVSVSPRRAQGPVSQATFAGNLKSEWIKLTTVRSTIWSLVILTVVTLGLAAFFAFLVGMTMAADGMPEITLAETRTIVVTIALGSISLTCLVVAVLGAQFSAGEYGTGSIRATMTATPRRLRVLWAKMLVLGFATFVFGFVLSLGSVVMTASMFAGWGHQFVTLGDPLIAGVIVGAAGYLAFTAIFACAIGFVFRSSAAAISIVVGILFALPFVVGIGAGLLHAFAKTDWLANIARYQFAASGQYMFMIPVEGDPLLPWQATLVALAWIAVATGVAVLVLKRKDS